MRIIKILTDKDAKDFNNAAPKHEVVIAGMFMVNCPACEAFKPEWNNFVESCKSEKAPQVLIAEVDSNQVGKINFDTSALEGFPTVYRNVKGEGVTEFRKERNANALRHFLKEAIAMKSHKGGRKKKTKKRKKLHKKRRRTRKRTRKRTHKRTHKKRRKRKTKRRKH